MAPPRAVTASRRGEVWLVSFDPTVGAEIKKTRPALIIQNDVANRHSPITIVAALTSRFTQPLYPTEVLVEAPEGGLTVDSAVLLNQIRSIDAARLIRRLGRLTHETVRGVGRVASTHCSTSKRHSSMRCRAWESGGSWASASALATDAIRQIRSAIASRSGGRWSEMDRCQLRALNLSMTQGPEVTSAGRLSAPVASPYLKQPSR
jgi:mRNA interferase MazF